MTRDMCIPILRKLAMFSLHISLFISSNPSNIDVCLAPLTIRITAEMNEKLL